MSDPLETPIVLATANPKKISELSAIFARVGLGVIPLSDLATQTNEPDETGHAFEDNAAIKAVSYAKQTGRFCLADDSGLEVDALGGAPGVISSHYCTDGVETGMSRDERDRANNDKLLRELGDRPLADRTARFVCVMVLASPDGRIHAISRGTLEGAIGPSADVPRGSNGFGYDPLFLVAPDYDQTSAELDSDTKNACSHRGDAARSIAEAIAEMAKQ
ncbi:MAG: non-canonical purine NTP pyrophosphatase [Planctomycetota bacterium]